MPAIFLFQNPALTYKIPDPGEVAEWLKALPC
jgi:hypothetical protein